MNSPAIFKCNNAERSVTQFWDIGPVSNSAIGLNLFPQRLLDGPNAEVDGQVWSHDQHSFPKVARRLVHPDSTEGVEKISKVTDATALR
jgi:hypothetical protein